MCFATLLLGFLAPALLLVSPSPLLGPGRDPARRPDAPAVVAARSSWLRCAHNGLGSLVALQILKSHQGRVGRALWGAWRQRWARATVCVAERCSCTPECRAACRRVDDGIANALRGVRAWRGAETLLALYAVIVALWALTAVAF